MVNVPEWTTRAAPVVTPRRRADVVVRELGGEVVFTDPRSGCSYLLNQTAWLVWQACDGTTTSHSIAHRLTETFDIDEDAALNDVEEVIGWFAAQGLCEEPSEP
ncbi:MAG: PqqD family protein [Planctomycetota bacterium]|jgi:hypothetical protein